MMNNNENLDVLDEKNKGPRITRFGNQWVIPGTPWTIKGENTNRDGNNEEGNVVLNKDQYNRPKFIIKYQYAKFFIIKSYSSDDR